MSTLNLHISLARAYTRKAFTHDYIFGFVLDYKVYAVELRDLPVETLVAISTVGRTSSRKGGVASLRFRPTNDIKRAIVEMGTAHVLCTKAAFMETVASNKYNKGENFERLVTEELCGETWVKDSVPFTDGTDVANWQVKFEGATFATERQLLGL